MILRWISLSQAGPSFGIRRVAVAIGSALVGSGGGGGGGRGSDDTGR